MKKYTDSILFLVVASLIISAVLNFILGSIPALSNDKAVTQINSSSVQESAPVSSPQSAEILKPLSTPTSESIHISTLRAIPPEDYQDAQWTTNVQKHLASLSEDVESVGNSTSSLDSDKLATYGQYLIDDTQTAIEENKQYEVSPKCQDAQNEWGLALQDYSSAGECMVKASEEAESNNTNVNDVKQAILLINSGSGHLNSVNEILKTSE